MKILANVLLAFAVFNVTILLTIMYWFTFVGGMPPFISNESPIDIVMPLIISSALAGTLAGFIKELS